MQYKDQKSTYLSFILIFVAIKIGLNFLAIAHFGFHRDELLHLVLADHLDWGYKEVPPFIALLAKISNFSFGDSVFAARVFPTIFSGLIILLTGLITVEFGGKKFAIAVACLSMIFSPAFAASGYLFQPVVFDQFWWVLAVWLLVKYYNSSAVKYVYFLGAAIGFGLLTKYTMGFFTLALILGIGISKQRNILLNKHIIASAILALLIILPNLIWQFQHHLPVIMHMKTLRGSQLDGNKRVDFIFQQFLINGIAVFLWVTGFIFLFFKLNRFQFLAIAFVCIYTFLLVMNGKSYYLYGAYPMLFAAGGFGLESLLKDRSDTLRVFVITLLIIPNFLLLPIVLPVLPLNQTLAFFRFTREKLPGINFIVTWEDHKLHATTQDYADMMGWNEMAAEVNQAWKSLTPEQQKHTQIYADNYGEAGAIHHFSKQYHLPDVISLNSSFTLWAPDNLGAQYIIYVDNKDGGNIKKFASYLESYRKIGEVHNLLAVENGTGVFLLVHPLPQLNERYRTELLRKRLE